MDISFGDAIRAARQSLGVKQEDLADRVGMKRSQLSRLENGNPKNPGMPTRLRLADGLGITVDEVMRIGRDYIDSSPMVVQVITERGTHLTLTQWHRYHDELIARAGVPDIRLHDMRHTYATLALDRGIHPRVVQEVLGHRSIKITMDTYSHVSRDLQAAAAEALDAHLFPESESGKLAQMTHT